LSDSLIIDYVNRFWTQEVDARMQLFDFKTKYQFETIPGICDYNMPLYSAQTEPAGQVISPFPVYQGLMAPAYANGISMPFYTQRELFYRAFPNYIPYTTQIGVGDGVTQTFQFSLPSFSQVVGSIAPGQISQSGLIPGHIDMTGIISTGTTMDPIFTNSYVPIPSTSVKPAVYLSFTNANGSNTVVADSGQFLQTAGTIGNLYGLMFVPGNPPNGDSGLSGGYSITSNTVNYNTGIVNITFPTPPPAQAPINAQCTYYQPGLPRQVLFFNNTITIRPPPSSQFLIELDAYLTPAAMLSSSTAIPFAYMAEYVARGAARKILSDTGDWEQFQAYEPLFIEQERLVWKRSQRIFTSTRTPTIFAQTQGMGDGMANNSGNGSI
jgi:hypothetical protein